LFLIQFGEGGGQIFQGTRYQSYIIGMTKIGCQCRLCRLIFKVATEIRSTQSATQLLLVRAEEMLCNIVGTLDHSDDSAVLIAARRMAKQVVGVAVEVIEYDRFR